MIESKFNKNKACNSEIINILTIGNSKYPKRIQDNVSENAARIKKEIQKVPESEDEIKDHAYRMKELEKSADEFKKKYPRFSLKDGLPDNHLYFGIHTGEYKDADRFLGQRTCSNPNLVLANSETAYLSLFFSMNNGRRFGGIVRIINERIVTLVEGSLDFSDVEKYFEQKRIPSATFRSWVHEDIERDFKGFVYQNQSIAQIRYHWEPQLFMGPWLYNSCNKSISLVHNLCSLDPSMDMEMKDIFYLTRFDLMLGNIYCKKSSDVNWNRLATFEFIRN